MTPLRHQASIFAMCQAVCITVNGDMTAAANVAIAGSLSLSGDVTLGRSARTPSPSLARFLLPSR